MHQIPEEEEYTFRKTFNKWRQDLAYLWGHKFKIVAFSLIGAVFGILLAWKWPVTYSAKTTFVVEEGKGSGTGLLSSLAGQFGLDLGSMGGSGTSGVLAGDNVLQLLVSQKMLKQTILTPYKTDSNYTLADRYAEIYKYKPKWEALNNGQTVRFPANPSKYTRLQDSLLQVILRRIGEREVGVNKPDKKLSFFALTSTMKNEELSILFSSRLIEQATSFYIQTKTKRLTTAVARLQKSTDSVRTLLNGRTMSTSASSAVLFDVNPAYATAGVSSELQERDKRVLQTVYSEYVKNLEVSKNMLLQETPTFQVVDTPYAPLKKNKLKYTTAAATGIMMAAIAFSALLLMRRKD